MKSRSESKKKRLTAAIIITAAVFILLLLLAVILRLVLTRLDSDGTQITLQSSNDYLEKSFRNYYPEDYGADLTKDEEYMSLDRGIKYTDASGLTVTIDSYDDENLNEGQRFFKKYFDIAVGGKYELYPNLFTDSYKSSPDGFEKHPDRTFPPQRIYNISVKELARTDSGDESYSYEGKPCEFGFYAVEFMILKNGGCFRRDLPENGSRALIMELVTFDCGGENETTYIKNLYTPDSIAQSAETSDS